MAILFAMRDYRILGSLLGNKVGRVSWVGPCFVCMDSGFIYFFVLSGYSINTLLYPTCILKVCTREHGPVPLRVVMVNPWIVAPTIRARLSAR